MKLFRTEWMPLTLILLLASVLRLWNISEVPPALSTDELVNGYDAWCMSLSLHDHHGAFMPLMFESFGDWVSPVLTYLTIPFVKLFGLTPFAVRLPVALLGIAAVYLFFRLMKTLFNSSTTALIGALCFALAPVMITTSRWAIPPSIVPFMLLLFLNTFFWALKKASVSRFLLVAAAGVLVVYSYPVMKLFFPAWCAFLVLIYRKQLRWNMLPGALLFALCIAPLYYLSLRYPEIYNARFENISIASTGENPFTGFLKRYVQYLTPFFFFGGGDTFISHHVPGFGALPEVLAFFSYVGIVAVAAAGIGQLNFINQKVAQALIAFLVLFAIPASVTFHTYTTLRTLHGFLLMLIMAIAGIHFLLSQIRYSGLLSGTLAFLLLVNTLHFSNYYFGKYTADSRTVFHAGIKEVFTYLEKEGAAYDKITVNTNLKSENGLLMPYIYLLFYSRYNPALLTKEMMTHTGKYYFEETGEEAWKDKPLLYSSDGGVNEKYNVYKRSETELVVIRQVIP